MKQVRTTFIFLAFLGIAYAAYLVLSGQLDDFVRALIGVNPKWIIAGVACFLCYYVFGILAYAAIVVVDHDSPVGFRDLMSVEASGVFFMRLTPGGAGVIPSQIYRLTRAGLSLPDASALQFVRFTLYEAGEGIFAAIMLLFCGDYFLTTFADVKILGLDVVDRDLHVRVQVRPSRRRPSPLPTPRPHPKARRSWSQAGPCPAHPQ